jgi:hypothetical protein
MTACARRAAVVVVAAGGNRYRQLERDVLPGAVPNTPGRRLSLSIRTSTSLAQLLQLYNTQVRALS